MKSENFKSPNRIDRLFDAFSEQTLSDAAEVRARMEEQEIDPVAITSHGRALINRLKGKAELAIAKQQTIQRYERAKQQILQRLETISDPAEFLTSLLAKRGQTALQANFRKVFPSVW